MPDQPHEEGRLAFGVCGLGSGAQAGGLAPWARRRVLPPALLACLVWLLGRSAGGQLITNVIDAFNTNTYPNGSITNKWSNWFGGAFQSLSLDPTIDANSNANSGSLKIVANFPVATDQFTVWNGYTGINPSLNGIQFTNFQCDVRFATGSATNSSGNFGALQFGMGTVSWGQDYWNSGMVIPASNTNWVHVSLPLNVNTDTNLDAIANVFVHIWGAGLVGPSTLWVDNIEFVGMATNSGTATINYTNTQQRIDGFGASSAWMSGSLANSDADLLFSTNTGAGLSLLRTRIAPDGTTWEGTIAQQAAARGARIWSTPWTPPTSFKLTNSWIATNDPNGWNGGWFSNTVANCQGYASQLAGYVSWVQTNYGISLYGISIQNEPDANVNYESCQWTSQDIHDFLPYLKAAMTASNVAATKILLPEDEHWQWNLATNTMNDPATSNQVDILAGHNYGSSAAAVTQFGTPCPKTIWETEHFLGTDDSITNGLQLAQEIHSFMTVAQANAYHYWWLTGSGTGSIADDTANPAKRLFVMGNYSRFVRPNFYRVGATNNTTALISAYKDTNSFSFVIVAANPTAYPVNQTFVLTNFPQTGTLTQWVTSATLSLSNQGPVSVNGNAFTYLLPAWTAVTFSFIQPSTNAPVIVQPPVAQAGVVGGSATFGVTATGAAPLCYQWFFNGTNSLFGATNASLTLTALALTNAGNYSVIVTNNVGSVTSLLAPLTVTSEQFVTLTNSDAVNSNSWNVAGNWSNGQAPGSGANYSTAGYLLRTPASGLTASFAGDSLTLVPNGAATTAALNIKLNSGGVVAMNNCTNAGGPISVANSGSTYTVSGNMWVGANTAFWLQNDATRILVLSNLNLSGSAASITNGSAGNGLGTIIYACNAAHFTGSQVVNFGTILEAYSQTNLFGSPAGFNAAQLVLDNGTFAPLASMALNSTNSGLTLNPGGGTFNVASGLTLAVSNPVAGSGSLVKVGGGSLMLAGTNTYAGSTTVSNGVLALIGNAGLSSSSMTIAAGATLDVSSLAVPLVAGSRLSLAGNLVTSVNNAGVGSRLLASNVVYGGTLTLSNRGPAFAAGNAFPLFTATNYSGVLAGISPTTPGAGLVWDTSKLAVSGTLGVAMPPLVSVTPAATNLVYGASLVLAAGASGTGPLSYQWYLNQTNAIPGAVFSSFTNAPAVAGSGNYSVVVTNLFGRATNLALVSVNPASLTVTAKNANKVYGATLTFSGTEFTVAGLLNSDTVVSATLASAGAGSSAPAGSYPITVTNALGTGLANYSIHYVSGALTVFATNAGPQFTSFSPTSAGLIFSGTNGGSPGTLFYTLASSNLATPLTAWMVIATNQFGPGGSFIYTNLRPMNAANWYFRLNVP